MKLLKKAEIVKQREQLKEIGNDGGVAMPSHLF